MSATSPPMFRRIVTSHHPSDTTGSHVIMHDSHIPLRPVLSGNAHTTPLYSSPSLPTTNPHTISPSHITAAVSAVDGVVLPGGTNGQVTQLEPGFRVEMHRTSSVDYNVIVQGSVWLIVPDGQGGESRTQVTAGEVVVQTGTIHAWQAGPDGVRWVTVVVAAHPVEVDGQRLGDVDYK